MCGRNACRALFARRPDDIRRVYVTEQTLPFMKDVLKACAERRIAYHVKTDDDLDQIAETVHHDGVLFLAKRSADAGVDELYSWAKRLTPKERAVVVLLENVKNPHNLGAILRVCAHFGVRYCLRAGETPELSPAVMRTAEGGAEFTRLVAVGEGRAALQKLRSLGFTLLATSSHASLSLGQSPLPERTVVLLGSEGSGLTPELLELADDTVVIPGSGALESLNVACASSVVLWELSKEPSSPGAWPRAPTSTTSRTPLYERAKDKRAVSSTKARPGPRRR